MEFLTILLIVAGIVWLFKSASPASTGPSYILARSIVARKTYTSIRGIAQKAAWAEAFEEGLVNEHSSTSQKAYDFVDEAKEDYAIELVALVKSNPEYFKFNKSGMLKADPTTFPNYAELKAEHDQAMAKL